MTIMPVLVVIAKRRVAFALKLMTAPVVRYADIPMTMSAREFVVVNPTGGEISSLPRAKTVFTMNGDAVVSGSRMMFRSSSEVRCAIGTRGNMVRPRAVSRQFAMNSGRRPRCVMRVMERLPGRNPCRRFMRVACSFAVPVMVTCVLG